MSEFASRQLTIAPWSRSSRSYGEGIPPHCRPGETQASLDVVWADPDRTVVAAVNDHDGCYALPLSEPPGSFVDGFEAALPVPALDALRGLAEVFDWIEQTHRAALVEMPTELFRRIDKARAALVSQEDVT